MIRYLLIFIEVVVCLMIIGLVLIQRSKGEGLSAAIGGGMGEALFGANVGNVVTRTTVILGIVFLVNTIILTMVLSSQRGGSVVEETAPPPASGAPALPGGMPPAPAPMPAPAPAPAP
jgi:preprotein translocase subunit SecG